MPSLELQEVTYAPILAGLSARWLAGEFVGLIGPNGAGKTTLLRLAAGVWAPDAGTVRADGQSLRALSVRERAQRIAYLPQALPDDVAYTVREFVEMGRFAHHGFLGGLTRECHDAVQRALEQFKLTELADKPLVRLSGGERQRAALARCIAQDTRVLLLDEPISNLDVRYQLDILGHLRNLSQSGLLVVMSIHHLEFAARYCSRLILLNAGRIVASGPVGEVLTKENIEAVFQTPVETYSDPFAASLRISYADRG